MLTYLDNGPVAHWQDEMRQNQTGTVYLSAQHSTAQHSTAQHSTMQHVAGDALAQDSMLSRHAAEP